MDPKLLKQHCQGEAKKSTIVNKTCDESRKNVVYFDKLSYLTKICLMYNCAKRSLRPWDSQNWVFRVFVRSFVRPCQISMIFIEKKVGGKQMPPSSEILKHLF